MADAESRWWPAPAKLNLMLHVVGRRADGYHQLQTLFQLLDYGDRLRFVQDSDIRRPNGPEGVDEDDDLTVRAARLLRSEVGIDFGVSIEIDKRIPLGGGLGGGSSDAATTLVALNHLFDFGLPSQRLAELGLQLGADVPLFVHGMSAWGEGVGERLTSVSLREQWFIVATPDVHIDTGEVYRQFSAAGDLTVFSPKTTMAAVLRGEGINALAPVVKKHYPECAELLDFMSDFGEPKLTGSGASVFVEASSADQAAEIAARIPDRYRVFCAKAVDRSPLQTFLGTSPSW